MWDVAQFLMILIPVGILVGEFIYAGYYAARVFRTPSWNLWTKLTHKPMYRYFMVAVLDAAGSILCAAFLGAFLPPSLGGPVGMFLGLPITIAVRFAKDIQPLA